ncbi:type IV pilin protein, partial [uncultured Caballeronia sp.]|uniref:type IV pilin protein n=1 Tax=uncultured Caballeronia sp. TaxID=1827198 RepID=UPI0035C9E3A2
MNTTAYTLKGFSLLELMITLGVAAIIAMFAMPVYQQQVMKGHRLDAGAAIYRAAQYVESARSASGNDAALKLPEPFGLNYVEDG